MLMTVKAVLLDAEEKQVSNNDVRVWLIKLKDVLYDAEDVLDEFECETQRKQLLKLYGSTTKKVGRFFSSSNPLAFSFKMSHKIKQIREQLDEIASHKAKFHLNERDEESNLEVPLERIGSLKHLRLLFLPDDFEIQKVPNSICKLQNLQSLLLPTEELPNDIRCERGEGEDWSKIAHIPKIVLDDSEINSTDDSHIDSTSED
ncbi:hypothetical protein GH714_034050 [Hevea brasiliensis]|uniref:Disease resistance N-terminal domain-containing protein n=1 Tax=Hevea brasiliensis TaxID=3981 RepID=A0A6A6M2R0_HEVBR|nr:hypothetical protein GH714_034050 [Hevea brasiliensis]